jgi:hypothetical protein
MGARVQYCGHDGFFLADIYSVAGANIVRANGSVSPGNLTRPADEATHILLDFPLAGFWRPDLGVFAVPQNQVTEHGATETENVPPDQAILDAIGGLIIKLQAKMDALPESTDRQARCAYIGMQCHGLALAKAIVESTPFNPRI